MRRLVAGMVVALLAAGCGEEAGISPADLPADSSLTSITAPPAPSTTAPATTAPAAPPEEEAATTTVVGDTVTTTGPVVPEGSGTTMQGTIDPGMGPYIDIAVTDLATRLGIDPSTVEVLSATLVTWPDAGMGCPQPGMRYLQVPQDGSLIELRAAGKIYRYHSGGSRPPFLCEQPPDKTPPATIDLTGGGEGT